MAKRHIYVDRTEVVLIYMGKKKANTLNLSADRITRIQFDKIFERKLFKKIPSEKITFMIRGMEQPIVYLKKKEKEFFENYKQELTEYAKENHVSFSNNLDN